VTEDEKQQIRERLELSERIANLPTVTMNDGKIINPLSDYRDVIQNLLDALDAAEREVERLKQERFEFGQQTIQNFLSIGDTFLEVKKEEERLRKALEFYASEQNNDWHIDSFDQIHWSKVMEDDGDIARQALAGEKKFFKGYKPYEYFKVGDSE
jgi:hypothetical protein